MRCRLQVYAIAMLPDGDAKGYVWIEIGKAGSEGKSTLLKMLKALYADKYVTLESILFSEKKPQLRSDALMQSLSSRIAAVPDFSGTIANVDLVKQMTGRDEITPDAKYKNPIYGTFTGLLVFNSNGNLSLAASEDPNSLAVRSRVKVMEFNKSYVRECDFDPSNPAHLLEDPTVVSKLLQPEYISAFFRIKVGVLQQMQNNGQKFPQFTQGSASCLHPAGSMLSATNLKNRLQLSTMLLPAS